MAIATISWIPAGIEPYCWLAIFVFCAWQIAKKARSGYFLHGLLVSIFNSIWITAIHVAFFSTYMAHHPDMASMSAKMPLHEYPRRSMVLMGPFVGVAFGLIQGLFAFVAHLIIRKSPTAAA